MLILQTFHIKTINGKWKEEHLEFIFDAMHNLNKFSEFKALRRSQARTDIDARHPNE